MSASDFLGVVGSRGTVRRRRVPVGALPDGSPISLPVIAIRGEGDGPSVYIQAGVHGDEATGIAVALEVLRKVTPAMVTGCLVVVPTANPAAFITHSRGFALEERGPIDLNRGYPGNERGLLSERILSIIFGSFVLPADLTIDLHSALAGATICTFASIDPDDDEHGTLQHRERLAAAFDADFVYRRPGSSRLGTSDMSHSLPIEADRHGKVTLSFELGEADRVRWDKVDKGAQGVLNVLRAAGVLRGEATMHDMPPRFSTIRPVHSEFAGLFRARTELGHHVAAGQTVGEVIEVLTQRRHIVHAPEAGHVLRLIARPSVMPGAELAWIVR